MAEKDIVEDTPAKGGMIKNDFDSSSKFYNSGVNMM